MSEAFYGNSQFPFEPVTDPYIFRHFLSRMGNTMTIIHMTDQHCSCFDEITGQADPSCSICGGLGKIRQKIKTKGYFLYYLPHGIYRASTITVGGENKRYDATIFLDARMDGKVEIGDLVEFDNKTFRIVAKLVGYGTRNRKIFVRLLVFNLFGKGVSD